MQHEPHKNKSMSFVQQLDDGYLCSSFKGIFLVHIDSSTESLDFRPRRRILCRVLVVIWVWATWRKMGHLENRCCLLVLGWVGLKKGCQSYFGLVQSTSVFFFLAQKSKPNRLKNSIRSKPNLTVAIYIQNRPNCKE